MWREWLGTIRTPLLATVTLAGLAVTLWAVAPAAVMFQVLVGRVAMAAPGMLFVRSVAGPRAGWLPVVAFGPLLGFGASSLVLAGIWTVGGRRQWTIFAASALLLALLPVVRWLRERWDVPVTAPGDRAALLALLLVVPLVVGAPFANVGRHVDGGKAYRAYFTADYVWRRAVVAELAKGEMPPANPFYLNDPLHYYWLPHLASAVGHRSHAANLDGRLLVESVVIDAAFVAFLYGLARWFVRRPRIAAAGAGAAILCTSYEGLYAIWAHWRVGASFWRVRYLNIDALSRWEFGALPIDGLQRVLFYQPHHAVGYALGFLGVLAVTTRVRRFDPPAMVVAGVLLGLSTLVSSFAGLMLTAVAALYELCSCIRWRDWKRVVVHASASAAPLVLAGILVTELHYVDTGGNILMFGPNPIAFHNVVAGTALSFGPMLIVVLLTAWASWRAPSQPRVVFLSLAAICIAFFFFVDIRDHQNVYVGWRAGHLWFIGSAAISAIAFAWIIGLTGRTRALASGTVAAALLLALPTSLIDIYNTQDISNRAPGPGFPWTLVLTDAELEGFDWIKMHTPPTALMQVDPLARGTEGWAYLPAFAERRMAVGLPISMVPLRKYELGSRLAASLFDADVPSAHEMARRYGVQYLVVGPPERERHPGVQERFDGEPAYFEPVFRNDAMAIYRVK